MVGLVPVAADAAAEEEEHRGDEERDSSAPSEAEGEAAEAGVDVVGEEDVAGFDEGDAGGLGSTRNCVDAMEELGG